MARSADFYFAPASVSDGAKIKLAREQMGLTQGKFCAKAGAAQSMLIRVERGDAGITHGMAAKLERGFGRKLNEILGHAGGAHASTNGQSANPVIGIVSVVDSNGEFLRSYKLPLDRLEVLLAVADGLAGVKS